MVAYLCQGIAAICCDVKIFVQNYLFARIYIAKQHVACNVMYSTQKFSILILIIMLYLQLSANYVIVFTLVTLYIIVVHRSVAKGTRSRPSMSSNIFDNYAECYV